MLSYNGVIDFWFRYGSKSLNVRRARFDWFGLLIRSRSKTSSCWLARCRAAAVSKMGCV